MGFCTDEVEAIAEFDSTGYDSSIDHFDKVSVNVVNKSKVGVIVDQVELRPLRANDSSSLPVLSAPTTNTTIISASTPTVSKGNNSAAHKGGCGGSTVDKKGGEEGSSGASHPSNNIFNSGSQHINMESHSTEL
jgi:hypothetical protein